MNNGGCEYLLWPKTCDKSCSITYRQASSKLFKLPKLTHNNIGQGWVTGGNPDNKTRETHKDPRIIIIHGGRLMSYFSEFRTGIVEKNNWNSSNPDLKNFENKKNPENSV